MTLDVAKCHACHTNSRGVHGDKRDPGAPQEQLTAISALCGGRCRQAPRLPHKVKVYVAKSMSMPALQSDGRCRQAPRLPHKVQVDAAKRHACHTNSRGIQSDTLDPSAPPEPAHCHKRHASHAECTSVSPSATPATQSEDLCRQVPRLPHKVKVDVAKCHACHINSRGVHGDTRDPTAPPEPAQCHKCHACHSERTSMSLRWPHKNEARCP